MKIYMVSLLHRATIKKSPKPPSGHHRTILSGYIFAIKARIDNRKKNLLSSNMSSTCPHNMVNFGPLAAEIRFTSLGHPYKFQRLLRLGSVTARQSSSVCQPNFAALNRGHRLCSAGRPSRWALAHISSFVVLHSTWKCYEDLFFIILIMPTTCTLSEPK